MRRVLPLLLLLGACAPAAQSPLDTPTAAPARVESKEGGYDIQLSRADHPVASELSAPVDRAWAAALEAYRGLGLRLDQADAARHQAHGRMVARRLLNGTRLSDYFDCGNEASGAIADTWRLSIEAQLGVGPGRSPGSSVMASMFTVRASPVEGTSTSVSQCSSRGVLELRLADMTRQNLGAAPK